MSPRSAGQRTAQVGLIAAATAAAAAAPPPCLQASRCTLAAMSTSQRAERQAERQAINCCAVRPRCLGAGAGGVGAAEAAGWGGQQPAFRARTATVADGLRRML